MMFRRQILILKIVGLKTHLKEIASLSFWLFWCGLLVFPPLCILNQVSVLWFCWGTAEAVVPLPWWLQKHSIESMAMLLPAWCEGNGNVWQLLIWVFLPVWQGEQRRHSPHPWSCLLVMMCLCIALCCCGPLKPFILEENRLLPFYFFLIWKI